MAWDVIDGFQHILIGDAFTANAIHELFAEAFVPVCIVGLFHGDAKI